MKTTTFLLLAFVLCFSCSKEKTCPSASDLSAPEGFEVQKMLDIELAGDLTDIQFINESTGFMLANMDAPGTQVYKTNNGGTSWEIQNIPINKSPTDMLFLDENTGFITYFSDLPSPALIKTTDGGESWTELNYPEFEGNINDLYADADQNLFGRMSKIGNTTHIIKSTDGGQSWQTIFTLPSLKGQILAMQDNKLYLSLSSEEILVIDQNGNPVKTIQQDIIHNSIVDFQVINSDNMIITSSLSAIKTTDGGESWTQIFKHVESRIIDFTSPEDGFMVLQKGYCGDSPIDHGVIAHTTDGGQLWAESDYVHDLHYRFIKAQKLKENEYIILVDNFHGKYELNVLSAF